MVVFLNYIYSDQILPMTFYIKNEQSCISSVNFDTFPYIDEDIIVFL